MQVDERRDHSIRIPRPDHSIAFGTPNACNGCHQQKSPGWARDAIVSWFPASQARPHFVTALASERQGAPEAARLLRELAVDLTSPPIARASALERLGSYASEKSLRTLQVALESAEPLVVYGAVLGAAQLPSPQRVRLLTPLLDHRLRAVRVAAGKALAGAKGSDLSPGAQAALARAFTEVEQSFDVSASRPETHVERSAFELARGQLAQAETELKTALRLQPCTIEAYLNLADLERQRHDEAAAERAIRAALACRPQSAAAHHTLGLWLVRAHRTQEAIASLRRAADLSPSDPRFSYVLAVALAGNGARDEAIRVLDATLAARPNDASAMQALIGYLRESGQTTRAAELRGQLDSLLRE